MTKIKDLVATDQLSPLQQKLLEYLNENDDDVFSARESTYLVQKIGHGGTPSGLDFSLWTLHKKGLIDKERYGRKVYFGSKAAIRKLRKAIKHRSEKQDTSRPNEAADVGLDSL